MSEKLRARDLGIAFEGAAGPWNAITDVKGVEVGHVTLIESDSVRTGVTAIHPRGRSSRKPVYAGWFSLNGNGEMTGTAWIDECGLLETPIVLTNTHSVGIARDAIIAWQIANGGLENWSLPVVAETYDGALNDINGFHVKQSHVLEALDAARSGPVVEGNVGGGTGMICHGYKGGIGTSSRVVGEYSVGALVQANHGRADQLRVGGVRIASLANREVDDRGSIIVLLATDAPMLPHQTKALAKRAALGLGRTGSVASLASGDIFLGFATGNALDGDLDANHLVVALGQGVCSEIYEGAVQATEEAIINALVAAETMTGRKGLKVKAIDHELLRSAAKATQALMERGD